MDTRFTCLEHENSPLTAEKLFFFVSQARFSAKNFWIIQQNRIFVYNFGEVMTAEERERLSAFEAKLRYLISRYEQTIEENGKLKQQLQQVEEAREQALEEYRILEKRYNDLKMAATISLDGSDVRQTKLRLSQLVRDVDKCIALLNE